MDNQNNNELKIAAERDVEKHTRVLREKINRFLSKENPSDVLIIKSHLICEYYINQILIVKNLCTAKELSELTFYNKVTKAFDAGLPGEKLICDKIIELNKLRNKVGHELEYVLSESDVDTLGYIFGKDYVFKKYDFTEIEELLRNTLIMIVADVSMFLFKIIFLKKTQ